MSKIKLKKPIGNWTKDGFIPYRKSTLKEMYMNFEKEMKLWSSLWRKKTK